MEKLKQFTKLQRTLIRKILKGKEKQEKTWVDEYWLLKEGIKFGWLKFTENKVSCNGYETINLN